MLNVKCNVKSNAKILQRLNFLQNRSSGGCGVGSGEDWSADDEMSCAVAYSVGWRGDALLVAEGGAGRTDARRDEERSFAEGLGKHADFLRAADESIGAAGDGEESGGAHLVGGSPAEYADIAQVCLVKRSQHRDGEDFGRGFTEFGGGIDGCAYHCVASDGMDGEKIDAELAGAPDGAFDGARDIMELEIEEDLLAKILHGLHDIRAFSGEKLQSDFVEADGVAYGVDFVDRLLARLNIESYD